MPVRKFTPEEVLRVIAERGDDAVPLDTSRVAEALRKAHGITDYRDMPKGNADVTAALAALVKRGELVTSKKKHTYGLSDRGPAVTDADRDHVHIVPSSSFGERWYATPAQSEAWAKRLAWVMQRNQQAATYVEALTDTFGAADLPLTSKARDALSYGKDPRIVLTLTIEQAACVLDALTGGAS